MPSGTTIHFVNHAGYLQRHAEVRLLVDPWIAGDAFHHGWSLLAPTATPIESLHAATHIWISHEHPDHFAPAFFKGVPEERRRAMTVLYQKTRDRKVLAFVERLGFRTREVEAGEWVKLGPSFEVRCDDVPIGDSFLVTRTDGVVTVNMNDCAHARRGDLRELGRELGHVDVLFSQFGYASWQGAPGETALRRELARAQLERMQAQMDVLSPRWVVPFASFSYFSAEENGYMNDGNTRIDDAVAHVRASGATPVVLYPGDEWTVGAPHDSTSAVARWSERYAHRETKHAGETVPLETLRALADEYRERMFAFHSARLVRAAHALRVGLFGPVDLWLLDHERAVRFDITRGLAPVGVPREACAAALHSEVLAFLVRFDYGLNTLSVNGRFIGTTGGFKKLVRAFALGSLKNDGRRFSPSLLGDRAAWVGASRAVFRRRA